MAIDGLTLSVRTRATWSAKRILPAWTGGDQAPAPTWEQVLDVRRLELPELTHSLLSEFGVDSEEDLRRAVKTSLERQLQYHADRRVREHGRRRGVRVECRQSNVEGQLIDWLQEQPRNALPG